ncbi:Calcineurin-like_phosphoesterase superfamily domain-containing protein [Hexamita inflata]|uniref:Calcineurin-like phosphoesterase superfamily domain-containing protein n=1 Tax=Hexamita inflata TaxID=28002 RepID=A0AA86QVK8_9EUKA|nr:Calcineurin-like phosphoesterase superfamily domain-containing protein [Hexamita inflata]
MNTIISEQTGQSLKPKNRKITYIVIGLIIICLTTFVSILVISMNHQKSKQVNSSKKSDFCYGPIAFMHEQGTRIHWCTNEKVESQLTGYPSTNDSSKSHYHSTFVNSTNFNYSLPGSDVQYSYYLPEVIRKFVIMTDTHTNTKYTSKLNEIDFDFMFHNGDMTNDGTLQELATGLANWPTKPMLFATGNHEFDFTNFQQVTQRPLHYYQQIRNIGVFVVYTLDDQDKDAFNFLNDNAHLAEDSEHVFIITHNPTYATGGHGAISKLSKKMEKFVDTHQNLNLRAVFSGHNHVFTAFKRNDLLYFVNGVGGGNLNDVYSKKKMGERVWKTEELHGPLEEVNDQSYGYQHHLDSYSKYTRTEVQFDGNRITYSIRDLDSNEVVQTYEQTF